MEELAHTHTHLKSMRIHALGGSDVCSSLLFFKKLPNSISEIHFKRVILIDAHEKNLHGSFCLAGKCLFF